jgi:hypothetical protein
MVFLSNLGWQISVWNTSCYCSSSWWWWWLLLWDLLERCKEVPFFPLRDLFGGGTWIRRADFCWRKILYSRSGCSFSQWQATTERGFNQLSTKIHVLVSHILYYCSNNTRRVAVESYHSWTAAASFPRPQRGTLEYQSKRNRSSYENTALS